MKSTIAWIFLGSVLGALPAAAGTWIAGGGQFLTDENNPWFLQNTETMRFCIKSISHSFSADSPRIETALRRAYAFWKNDFDALGAAHTGTELGQIVVSLATQKLVHECGRDPDVTILAGLAIPGSDQLSVGLQTPLGVTVRTHYNKEHLKGRGFVFLAPDQGEGVERFRTREGMWSQGMTLEHALAHELGHVFGIAHSITPSVMHEGYLQRLTLGWAPREMPESFLNSLVPREFGNVRYMVCNDRNRPFWQFFGFSGDSYCLSTQYDGERMVFHGGPHGSNLDNMPVVGTATVRVEPGCREELVVSLFLSPEQQVFGDIDSGESIFSRRFPLTRRKIACLSGQYESVDGTIRRAFGVAGVETGTFPPKFSGSLDGIFHNDLFNAYGVGTVVREDRR